MHQTFLRNCMCRNSLIGKKPVDLNTKHCSPMHGASIFLFLTTWSLLVSYSLNLNQVFISFSLAPDDLKGSVSH